MQSRNRHHLLHTSRAAKHPGKCRQNDPAGAAGGSVAPVEEADVDLWLRPAGVGDRRGAGGRSVHQSATGNRAGGALGIGKATTGSADARRVTTDERRREGDRAEWPAQHLAWSNGRQHAQLGGSSRWAASS